MNKELNKEWVDWINLNISRGCEKEGIYEILIDEGFDVTDVERQMGYQPKVDIDNIPKYTPVGFKKGKLNAKLFAKIKTFYKENKKNSEVEIIEGFIHTSLNKQPASRLLNLSENLKKEIHMSLKPMLEDWSNIQLEPTFVYGIRIYGRDAVLKEHRDREQTHKISAIINVDQEVDSDWPLVIDDHHYQKHHILLDPGEVLFYEGARLKHGRPIPFNGQSYANIFCHFKVLEGTFKKTKRYS